MNADPDDVGVGLSAWIDDELDPIERRALAARLATDERLRAELVGLERARAASHAACDEIRESAPPFPMALELALSPPAMPRPRWSRRFLSRAAPIAATILVMAVVVMVGTRDAPATPRSLLERAADGYAEFDDVELYVDFQSSALDFLQRLGDSKAEGGARSFRLEINKAGQYVMRQLKAGAVEEVSGFDGRDHWTYRPGEGTTTAAASGPIKVKVTMNGADGTDADLFRFLSWDFVRDLKTNAAEIAMTEVTGPSDTRAGRRTFRLSPSPSKDGETRWAWTEATITIDPRRDLIEKFVLDVQFAAVSLLRVQIEVGRVDQHLRPAYFRLRSHAPASPAGTPK